MSPSRGWRIFAVKRQSDKFSVGTSQPKSPFRVLSQGLVSGCWAMRSNGPIGYIVLYAAMYAAFGVASPFWPKFFETRALTSQQIGLILAAAMLVRLAAGPVVGRVADLWGSLRLMLATCAALAAGMAAALSLAN